MSEATTGAAAFAIAVLLTAWLRGFARRRNLIDVPNARSSHVVPTPRGGGAAIVVAVLVLLPVLLALGQTARATVIALAPAAVAVAAVGWIDDRRGLAVRIRLLAHFAAAAWAVAWLGGVPPLDAFGRVIDFGPIGVPIGALFLVWLLNLYNFMDGIDGIAAVEAITVAAGGAVLARLVTPDRPIGLMVVLAAACAGFLVWNFPRARIFMGDVGSGFLGVTLGTLALAAGAITRDLFWGWLILLGAFVADATVTLIRRLIRRERVHEAHRSHAYQQVARRLGSHVPVTLAYGAINLLALLPLAAGVATGRIDPAAGLLIAYIPLVLLALLCGAGRPSIS